VEASGVKVTEISILLIIVLAAVVSNLHAQVKSLREWNACLRSERDLWIDKATVKQGIGLLGREREPHKAPENANPAPKIVSRSTLEQRAAEKARTSPVEHVEKVVPRSVIEKAKGIIDRNN
jgi:hypothetical protein